uniref:Uncharacterized protein n=1 Tax=Anguilla anguilla TaxID=7936 RepID=A0A0E9SIZ5_ANGAN
MYLIQVSTVPLLENASFRYAMNFIARRNIVESDCIFVS